MNANLIEQLLTVGELAARWQVTDAYIYRMCNELQLPAMKIGGNIRFAFEDILNFEQSCKLHRVQRRR